MSAQNSFHSKFPVDWRDLVSKNVESLDFGSVEIVIHDSRIVHIDTTQRFRLERERSKLPVAASPADQRVPVRQVLT